MMLTIKCKVTILIKSEIQIEEKFEGPDQYWKEMLLLKKININSLLVQPYMVGISMILPHRSVFLPAKQCSPLSFLNQGNSNTSLCVGC